MNEAFNIRQIVLSNKEFPTITSWKIAINWNAENDMQKKLKQLKNRKWDRKTHYIKERKISTTWEVKLRNKMEKIKNSCKL